MIANKKIKKAPKPKRKPITGYDVLDPFVRAERRMQEEWKVRNRFAPKELGNIGGQGRGRRPFPDRKKCDPLLGEIQALLAVHDVTSTQFGVLACNDTALLYGLKRGRRPGKDRRRKIEYALKLLESGKMEEMLYGPERIRS